MNSLQVSTTLDGRTFRGTLQADAAPTDSPPADPVQHEPAGHQPRIRPCLKRHGGASNNVPLFSVNVRYPRPDGTPGRIERFAVGADVIEHGKRRLWLRPEYASTGTKMKAYSRNNKHANHGFSLEIALDGTAIVDYKGRFVQGQARNPKR
jgi:hypothetical protein